MQDKRLAHKIMYYLYSNDIYRCIVHRLLQYGFEVYIVGGFIRDIILDGGFSDDVDFTTNATPFEIATVFNDKNVNFVGKSYLVTLVDNVQVATFRKDKYKDGKRSNCIVEQTSKIETDLSRRDLTINAIAFSPATLEFIDLFFGYCDIMDKKIKFIGNPYERIDEDNERILRACRFLARLGGSFEHKTFLALKDCHSLVENIPKDRIMLEIIRAMKIRKASEFFRALHLIGVLQHIFPSLVHCINHDGGPYHNETVFEHCMDTGDAIHPKYWRTKLAGYLHDIGKPPSASYEPGTYKIKFIGHEKEGACRVRDELRYLRFSNNDINFIYGSIKLHMRSFNKKLSKRALRRLLVDLKQHGLSYKDWFRLFIADKHANRKSRDFKLNEIRAFVKKIKNFYEDENMFSIKDLEINGHDVMNILKIKEGKMIGIILRNLFNHCLDIPDDNNREKLIELTYDLYERLQ